MSSTPDLRTANATVTRKFRAHQRRIQRSYDDVLRRAHAVGWPTARAEYRGHEVRIGRDASDVDADLLVFDMMNARKRNEGSDPVASRHLDDMRRKALLLAVPAASIFCAVLAMAEVSRGTAILASLVVFTIVRCSVVTAGLAES